MLPHSPVNFFLSLVKTMHIHSHAAPPVSVIEPDVEVPQTRLQPWYRSRNPLDYRIHIGWFGGLRIYSIADNALSETEEL